MATGPLVALAVAAPVQAAGDAGWTIVTTPRSGISELVDVSGTGSDAWAVGDRYDPASGDTQALAEHWDGATWSIVATPDPGTDVQLNAVADVAPDNAWAVGFSTSSGWGSNKTLVEHWDGTRWSQVASPDPLPSANDLWGVYAVSASDVWAVGRSYPTSGQRTLIEHWNGTSWAVVPSPDPTSDDALHSVTGRGADDIWAAGTERGATSTGVLIEHWDGKRWSTVPAPGVEQGDYVRSITEDAAGDAWVIGQADTANATPSPLVERWNGSAWGVVTTANLGAISGVFAVSPTDVWIVGVRGYPGNLRGTLTERWNGSAWQVVASPNRVRPKDGAFDTLNAVTNLGSGPELVAVGSWEGASSGGGTLVLTTPDG